MCDTCVVLPSASLNRKVWFAKNSDRHPNEPNIIIVKPEIINDLTKLKNLDLTYISIPQVEKTNSFIMVKPIWTWGCEMGVNSFNVCIGNEAVFTKGAYPKSGIIGMDICRLVLERCSSALEGALLIGSLIEEYEQGGNCGFGENFYYDNSFLIADSSEAYVVETAGKEWVAKRCESVHAISNYLSINGEWDFSCKSLEGQNGKLNFSKKHTETIRTRFGGGNLRRYSMYTTLLNARDGKAKPTMYSIIFGKNYESREKAEGIKYETFREALRFHLEHGGYTESPCMHYGGMYGSHTTGSLIACPEIDFISLIGGSTPCRSIYMPYFLGGKLPFGEDEDEAERYWLKRELIKRNLLASIIDEQKYINDILEIEGEFDKISEIVVDSEKDSFNKHIFETENEFVEKYYKICSRELKKLTPRRGSILYKRRWNKVNEALLERINEVGL